MRLPLLRLSRSPSRLQILKNVYQSLCGITGGVENILSSLSHEEREVYKEILHRFCDYTPTGCESYGRNRTYDEYSW